MSNIKEINTDGVELKEGEYLVYVSDGSKYVAVVLNNEWSEESMGLAVNMAVRKIKNEQYN